MEKKDQIENLSGSKAAKKIKELVEASRTCMMVTCLDKMPLTMRPMAVQKTGENGCIYFLSHRDTHKNDELHQSPAMQLVFMNSSNSEYLSLFGEAEVYRNQDEIEEMYTPIANVWFEGKEDPNITIICFHPESGYYWDTKNGKMIQLAGMLVGALTGKETDNSVEGRLKP